MKTCLTYVGVISMLFTMVVGCTGQDSPAGQSNLNNAALENQAAQQQPTNSAQSTPATEDLKEVKMEKATFGAGCFWCVEAVFQRLKGVDTVKSGYMGGSVENPSYRAVCSGTTGHAEVCHVEYDANTISFDELLEVFWKTHDPTTLNRQGNDKGTQYRSAVFYHSDAQKETAEAYKKKLNDAAAFPNPIVTEIVPASTFYEATADHQNYWKDNPNQPYCRAIIPAKMEKLKKIFADKLKDE